MAVFAVTTARGPGWLADRDIRDQPGWAEHATFADTLVNRGLIIIGGPITGGSPEDIALLAVVAGNAAEVRTIFADDPWTHNGVFHLKEIRPWTLWLDSRPPESRW